MKTFLILSAAGVSAAAQNPAAAAGTPVTMVVTAEGAHDKPAPPVTRDDVMAYQNNERRQVLEWVPARGERGALQFYLLIDDGMDTEFGTYMDELRGFVRQLPADAEVGVGYLRNGMVRVVQEPAADHERAAKAIRHPIGMADASGSPYLCVSDFVKKWPATAARREALLIASGVDPYFTEPSLDDPYVSRAIADAQRAGVIIYSIYFGTAGHAGHTYWRTTWGQNYLSQLSDQTGGESWWQGFSNPVSFTPFLDDLRRRLDEQYLLTIAAEPKRGLQSVRLRTELPHVSLVGASKVEVSKGK